MDALLHLPEGALAEGLGDPVVTDNNLLRVTFCLDFNLLFVSPFLAFLVHSLANEFKFNQVKII